MTIVKRKGMARLLTAFCVFALVLSTAPTQAFAASKNMQAAGATFTLKTNKAFTSPEWYGGVGKQKFTAKISKYQVKNAKKAGYKTLTFTAVYTRNWKPTRTQVSKMVKDMYSRKPTSNGSLPLAEGFQWCLIADYTTGRNLEVKANAKKLKVTVTKKSDWKYTGYETYYGCDGEWVKLAKKGTITYTVTYPKTYKGLCIGIGNGSGNVGRQAAANKIWTGTKAYTTTKLHKTFGKNIHWMRVK